MLLELIDVNIIQPFSVTTLQSSYIGLLLLPLPLALWLWLWPWTRGLPRVAARQDFGAVSSGLCSCTRGAPEDVHVVAWPPSRWQWRETARAPS